MAKTVDPAHVRAAVLAVREWIEDDDAPKPPRAAIADAVRSTARTLAQDAPGGSVEVRVPPLVAVQCVDGPRHTRGTPPNVVECGPRTWLRLATGLDVFDGASDSVQASGSRAGEIARYLPVLRL
ncbi:sterol carrier family protein [Tsukamurella sp. 1534]|uniref:sterol carrier family protein n=1 Tax=Tsukamurella sp. 1534 TaxID=1151061 RepID=UPI0003014B25|nr:sterol carrier family protein [Tsukamurella sp. 1534]